MKSLQCLRPVPLAIILVSLVPVTATAQTVDWNNLSGGSYFTTSNWTPAGVPGAASTLRFNLNNTYNISFNANATASAVTLNQGDVGLQLSGNTLQLTSTTNTTLAGTLRVNNGIFLPGSINLALGVGSMSLLQLEAGSNTTVGSGVFYVGTGGTGTALIRNGAKLTTSALTGLGLNASGVGTVTVQGTGSQWTAGSTLRVGSSGQGTLTVLSGGVVTANAVEVGESLGSVGSVTVSGANSTLTSNGTTNIGGAFSGFAATSAALTVATGGTVNLNGTTNLRTTGSVNVAGGTLNLSGLTLEPGAAVNWTSGKVQFADATTITNSVLDTLLAGTHVLGANRTLSALSNTMTLGSSLVVNGGTLTAGDLAINAGLTIGSFGTVTGSTVDLASGTTVQIEDFGTLGASSYIVNNGGTIRLGGPNAKVTGFLANNFGVLQGTGVLAGGMNIGTGATVRLGSGEHVTVDGFGPTSSGRIELTGGTIEYRNILTNLGNGFISGRGEFRGGTSSPGSTGLSNLGVMAFSGGPMDIRGDVINGASGVIAVAGGTVLTFYDDVIHNGQIQTNVGSRTVFFGSQSGSGSFTGPGMVEYNGDLRPGNSPGQIVYEGGVEFSSMAALVAELGGTAPGTEYDRLTVFGSIALDQPTLEVDLINGFLPNIGQSFTLIENRAAQDIGGSFANVADGGLLSVGDITFQASYFGGNGRDFTLTVVTVPEPGTLVFGGLATVVASISALYRRRTQSAR
jgi:T5SS/PEP-CTERM-associated repeat protein